MPVYRDFKPLESWSDLARLQLTPEPGEHLWFPAQALSCTSATIRSTVSCPRLRVLSPTPLSAKVEDGQKVASETRD